MNDNYKVHEDAFEELIHQAMDTLENSFRDDIESIMNDSEYLMIAFKNANNVEKKYKYLIIYTAMKQLFYELEEY